MHPIRLPASSVMMIAGKKEKLPSARSLIATITAPAAYTKQAMDQKEVNRGRGGKQKRWMIIGALNAGP
jgi:hypothetical protein